MLSCDYYVMPKSLHEMFDLMDVNRDNYRLVAGGTDLLPWAREGHGGDVHCPVIIDLSLVPELSGTSYRDGRVTIGANTSLQQFLNDPTLTRYLPIMQKCAIWFADQQIREQATIGGNIINASPCADTVPPMIALDGNLTLVSRQGDQLNSRVVPVADFILGSGKTVLNEGEILTTIDCLAADSFGSSFKKVGTRRSLVVSVANAAVLVKIDPARKCFTDVRISLGGIGPTPVRLGELESKLIGQPISKDLIHKVAADIPADLVRSRSRLEYRKEVIRNFFTSGILEALAEIGCVFSDQGEVEEVGCV